MPPSNAPAAAHPGPAGRVRRLLLVLGALLVGLLLAEGAHRAWLALRGVGFDSQQALASFASASAAAVAGPGAAEGDLVEILHPYFGAETLHDTGGVLRAFADEPRSERLRIVVLGGSVAFDFGVAVETLARERLSGRAELGGRAVELLNFAHHGYKQPQQLNKLGYLLARGARPDLVLELDGFNEIALARSNADQGTDPLYPTPGLWTLPARAAALTSADVERIGRAWALREETRELAACARRWGAQHSSLASTFVLRGLAQREAAIRELELALTHSPEVERGSELWRQLHGPDVPAARPAVVELCLGAWEECSVSMAALCAARDIPYLHVLQPTLWDPGSKPRTPREEALANVTDHAVSGFAPQTIVNYPRLRERGAGLARRGVRFVDASRVFAAVEEELYFDYCHFVEAGHRRLWEFLEPQVLQALSEARRPKR